jgi:hypothetical protein
MEDFICLLIVENFIWLVVIFMFQFTVEQLVKQLLHKEEPRI